MDVGVNIMRSPVELLKSYMRERGSVSILDAQIYLLGCGRDISYELTHSLLNGLCDKGFARDIGCHDTHGSPVYEIIE